MIDQSILSEYNSVRTTEHKDTLCHAPFTNMNFAQNGDATACCYNRTHVLGTYPANNVDEMWHGQKAQELRAYLKANVLPAGCEPCALQLLSRNFGGLRARSFDYVASAKYPEKDGRFVPKPQMMEFEISNVCNLECTMCNGFFSSSIRRHRERLPALKSPYDMAFVEQLEPFIPHLSQAKFLGGEPFLIRTYYRIWDMLIRLNPGVQVSITTNGTTLNQRVTDILEKLQAHIVVSVDSLEKENYERIRVNADFDTVMQNVRYYREYARRRNTGVTFAVCPMQQNWRELPTFLTQCNEFGINLFFNTVTWPEEVALQFLSRDELSAVIQHLKSVKLTDKSDVQRGNNANYCDLIQQVIYYRDNPQIPQEIEGILTLPTVEIA